MATITARGDKWQAKIRRDGYPSKSKTFDKHSDAETWARIQESEMDRGVWRDRTSAESTTFHDLLKQYLRDVVPGKKGATVEEIRIKSLQRDDITKYKLAGLNPIALADWRDRRLKAGCAGSTVNRELNIISAVLNWARRELMVQIDNPVAMIRRPTSAPGRNRRFEKGEEKRLMKAMEDHAAAGEKKYRVGTKNLWIKPLVLFAIETAMRRGEILGLTWANVDLKQRIAYIPVTKSGEPRTIPLSSRAVAVLEGLPRSIDGRVFPITVDALKKAFTRACERAGLNDFHFHDLRHEATSRLAERLPNLIELASVTGHKDLKMLKRYYHPRATDLAKKLG